MTEQQGFGVNVWWSIPTTVLDGEAVQNALEKHGFEKSDIPLPSRRTEVSRACYAFQNRRGRDERRITEKTQDNGKYVVYGILDQRRRDAEHVGFSQTTTVYLDKDTGEVRAEGDLNSAVVEAVHQYEGKVTDEDIRIFLRRVIRMCYGIAKRPSGGIYFVPSRFVSVVQSAQEVLNEIGSNARLYIEGVINGAQERSIVWESVESNVDGEIQLALASVERIEKSAKAVKSQKAKLDRLSEIVEVYKALLGKEAEYETIAEKIEMAVKQVSTKIAEIQMLGPAPKNTPKNTPKKKKRAKSAAKPRGSKVYESVVDLLKVEGKPMHYRAITQGIIENGSYSGLGKYAADSVRKVIQLAIDGGDDRVVVVRSGVYQIA